MLKLYSWGTESNQYQTKLFFRDYSMAQLFLLFTSVFGGILMCRILYNASKMITPWFFKGYYKLSRTEQVEWSNRVISTAHAILVSVVSLYLLFFSDIFCNDVQDGPVTLRKTLFSTFILGVSTGYFLSDLGMIIWFYPSLGGIEYVMHHLLSMTAIVLSLFSGHGQIYIYLVLLSESTTPSINLRWYLDTAGLKNSKVYMINGVAMFFGWLAARIFLFVYFFIHMYLHYDEVKLIFPAGFYFLFVAPPLLALMNLFWFVRIAKGMIKTLSKRAKL